MSDDTLIALDLMAERERLREALSVETRISNDLQDQLAAARAEVSELLPMLDAQDMTISNLVRDLKEIEAREVALREVLTELVACKDIKKRMGRLNESRLAEYQQLKAEYNMRKSLAWTAARLALDNNEDVSA